MVCMNLFVHLFFPHHTNNHKAKIIRPSGIVVVLAFLLLAQLGVRSYAKINPKVLGYAANISPSEVIRLTNEKRAQNGLPALSQNGSLSQAAQAKAAHMIANDYWAHVAPDGTQPWKFFGDAGYGYKFAGENLARDFSNPSATVDAWMASSSHRENLLSSKYKEIGVAVIEGDLSGVDTTIVVQMFGTRLGDTLPVAPVAAKAVENTGAPTVKPTTKPQAPKPTLRPTLSPTVTPTASAVVIAQAEPETQAKATPLPVLVSPLNVTKTVSGVIVGLLLIVLLVDMVVISRKRIARVSSRSFAHFAFFAMIVAIILIAKAGRIL